MKIGKKNTNCLDLCGDERESNYHPTTKEAAAPTANKFLQMVHFKCKNTCPLVYSTTLARVIYKSQL